MLRRRMAVFLFVAFMGCIAALLYALSLDRLFETAAVIQIENSAVTDSLATGQTATRAIQQLQRTEQRLMARENLARMVQEFELFAGIPNATLNERVFLLRQATRIEQVVNPALQWRTDVAPTALTISVRLGDAQKAADVANEFVHRVLTQNKTRRAEQVRETLKFFGSEEQRIGGEISNLDAEIAAFKRDNEGALPDAVAVKRTQLARLEDSDLVLEQQLIELQGTDAASRRALTLKQIAQLEEQRAAVAERHADISASINSAPQVEETFNKLNRQMAILEEQFTLVTRHRSEAEMGQMMEEGRQSENYEILERAQVPETPIAPSRKKTLLMGIIGSLAAGFAAVYALETLNPVIRTAGQMERQLGIKPVVSIPNITTRRDASKRWALKAAMTVIFVIAIPVSLFVVHEYVFPLKILAESDWLAKLAAR